MADRIYTLTITEFGGDSGPTYNVYSSTNCSTYTYADTVTLPGLGSQVEVILDELTTCVKLQSVGEFENEVISGSGVPTPTPLPLTYRATVVDKNSTGPNYNILQSTGSQDFDRFAVINLPNEGDSALIYPSSSAVAIQVESVGTCDTIQTFDLSLLPTPTPTPTPTATGPTPTPGPTSTPTPTPTTSPTPSPTPTATFPGITCNVYYVENTGSVAGSSVTFNACLDNTQYTLYNVPNDRTTFTSRTTPTTTGDAYVVLAGTATEPFSSWDTGSWDFTRVQDMEFRTGNDMWIGEFYNASTCNFETGSILANNTSLYVTIVSGSNTENGIPTINRGTIYTDGTCSLA